jgi:sugar diacid utilization regulator
MVLIYTKEKFTGHITALFTGIHWNTLEYTGIHWNTLEWKLECHWEYTGNIQGSLITGDSCDTHTKP